MEPNKGHNHSSRGIQGQGNSPEGQGLQVLMKKAEKLTMATYMVSDILSDKEPMRWKVRDTALEILSELTLPHSDVSDTAYAMFKSAAKRIEKMISLLDIVLSAHLMSEMNASILKKEYQSLREALYREWIDGVKNEVLLTDAFFEIGQIEKREMEKLDMAKNLESTLPMNVKTGVSGNTPTKTTPPIAPSRGAHTLPSTRIEEGVKERGDERTPERMQERMQERTTEKPRAIASFQGKSSLFREELSRVTSHIISGASHVKSATPTPERARTSGQAASSTGDRAVKEDRRKIILALLKQKSELTVRDIAKSIPGYSEKTIQRELLALVMEGTLVKRGERRWSTYSLKDN